MNKWKKAYDKLLGECLDLEVYYQVAVVALELIAAPASVEVTGKKKMYKAWRAIAVERIDLARDALELARDALECDPDV